ncbi:MAG: phenylacetaldoxime dehydratase family protein, partial [Pseudomonadota bacterium]
ASRVLRGLWRWRDDVGGRRLVWERARLDFRPDFARLSSVTGWRPTMPKIMPDGFTPPYEAYEATYRETELANAYIGIEDRGGDAAGAEARMRELLAGDNGPDTIEYGRLDATERYPTQLLMVYWRDPSRYAAWRAAPEVTAWFESAEALQGDVGRWIETAWVSPEALDTLAADKVRRHGLATLADEFEVTPYHGYWGGSRDRIRIADAGSLANPEGPDLKLAEGDDRTLGRLISVEMPHNVCLANGGPDWSLAGAEERGIFLDKVMPAFQDGSHYLRDNAEEANCYASRLIQYTDEKGASLERMVILAYFLEHKDLEHWTSQHPTHLRIFGEFTKMINTVGRLPDVKLWHEVSILPSGKLSGLYANCSPKTGFLPYAIASARAK